MRKHLLKILFISFIAVCLINISFTNIVRAEDVDNPCAACEIDPESQECLESSCIQRGADWYKEDTITTATGQTVTTTEFAPDFVGAIGGINLVGGTAGKTYSWKDAVSGASITYSTTGIVPGLNMAQPGTALFTAMYGSGNAAMAAAGMGTPTTAPTWGLDTQTSSGGSLSGQYNYSSVRPNQYMQAGMQMLNSPYTFGLGLNLIGSQISQTPNISGLGTTGTTALGFSSLGLGGSYASTLGSFAPYSYSGLGSGSSLLYSGIGGISQTPYGYGPTQATYGYGQNYYQPSQNITQQQYIQTPTNYVQTPINYGYGQQAYPVQSGYGYPPYSTGTGQYGYPYGYVDPYARAGLTPQTTQQQTTQATQQEEDCVVIDGKIYCAE